MCCVSLLSTRELQAIRSAPRDESRDPGRMVDDDALETQTRMALRFNFRLSRTAATLLFLGRDESQESICTAVCGDSTDQAKSLSVAAGLLTHQHVQVHELPVGPSAAEGSNLRPPVLRSFYKTNSSLLLHDSVSRAPYSRPPIALLDHGDIFHANELCKRGASLCMQPGITAVHVSCPVYHCCPCPRVPLL